MILNGGVGGRIPYLGVLFILKWEVNQVPYLGTSFILKAEVNQFPYLDVFINLKREIGFRGMFFSRQVFESSARDGCCVSKYVVFTEILRSSDLLLYLDMILILKEEFG